MFRILTSVLASILAAGPGPCRLDLNDSGAIDPTDLATLLSDWRNPYGPTDLAELLSHWRKGDCPTDAGPIRSDNAEGVRRLIFGETAETARIAIIGDSQAGVSTARLYSGVLQTWPLDWAVLPMPGVGRAPTSLGFNSIPLPGTAQIGREMGSSLTTGQSELPSQLFEHILQNIPTDSAFVRIQHDTNFGNVTQTFSRYASASTLRARIIHESRPGAAFFDGGSAMPRVLPSGPGPVVELASGGNGVVGTDVVAPNPESPGRFNIEIRGDESDEGGSAWIHYGSVAGEDNGAGGFVQAPGRPGFWSNVFRSGGRWSDFADETDFRQGTGVRWSWAAYAEYIDALSSGAEAEAPNVFFLMLGHNDGPVLSRTPAAIRDDIAEVVGELRAIYAARGHAQPRILLIHAWQTSTIDAARWRTIWREAYLPNASGLTAAVSIAELQGYVVHSERLDAFDLHPGDAPGAAFFFGANGLLGALNGGSNE